MREIRERRETIRREKDQMAETKLQLERKFDELENQVQRNTRAISTMAQWLVQAQTGFGAQDALGIEKILRGENEEEVKDISDSLGENENDVTP